MSKTCSVDDCSRPVLVLSRGLCGRHYHRFQAHGDPLAGDPERGLARKFFEDAKNFDGDECLFWPFGKIKGYGSIQVNGKSGCLVHRLICEHVNGPPPTPKHEAAHSCGNGHLACIARKHLRWATRIENEADKILAGTHGAKLTNKDVVTIRNRVGLGLVSQAEMASAFGVSRTLIYKIVHRKTWAHIP